MFLQSSPPNTESETFRNILAALTFVLSIINLIYAISIFTYKNRKDDRLKEKELRAAAFNTLVISPNIETVYGFFRLVEARLRKLRKAGITIEEKARINEYVVDQMSNLRLRFIDLFRSVSYVLYRRSIKSVDVMVDQFTNDIFNDALDFTDDEIFQERILSRLSACRTSILTQIISFDGSEDPVSTNDLSIFPR